MMMPKTLEDKLAELSPGRRKRVETRTTELIAEEQSLRDLRHALALTQEHMAEELGIRQDGISRLEKRSDLLLSTLRSYIEAMGGKLRLVAEFPNRPPVLLGGLQGMAAFGQQRRAKPGSSLGLYIWEWDTRFHRFAG